MKKEINLALSPQDAIKPERLNTCIALALNIEPSQLSSVRILRRSIDARHKQILINLRVLAIADEPAPAFEPLPFNYPDVAAKDPVLVVGAGPTGLFAALRLIEKGLKPIILERGKDVSRRKRDLALIHRDHILNPESNYCFGEGGAGTFSDGKLYTRSKKRGDNRRVLELLHTHGAADTILYETHPHIGSDRLPTMVVNLRKTILQAGGEFHFDTRVNGFIIHDQTITGVTTSQGDTFTGRAVILATGHSARDIYEILCQNKILLEAKPFAMGVRIEHPQALINAIQYHNDPHMDFLPPAAYTLAHQAAGRGVYSFCMCPGGFIVPSATAANECVVNGMSPSLRNSPFANAGLVVEIRLEDLVAFAPHGALAGLRFQQALEQDAFRHASGGQTAPAQRVNDFVAGKTSISLPEYSYIPGLAISAIHAWLPPMINNRLREALKAFEQKMRGFITSEAIIVGVESRTSSPVRIPRNRETFQHLQIKGLFPCGEGAGYAGGILSSAIDGENCASAVGVWLSSCTNSPY